MTHAKTLSSTADNVLQVGDLTPGEMFHFVAEFIRQHDDGWWAFDPQTMAIDIDVAEHVRAAAAQPNAERDAALATVAAQMEAAA
ncbi:hypothetical protein P3H15_52135 [Rhodococcus sp. T2V]|uniref:hypothetical protein n=1 Tax=Rhodococcus sp. T2V TaxID=3034164 RepID=UPI0023E1DCA3|nr:hypothetical protein [Rhodococcus sp. T2V]MDF3313456.1 hypothetical protein [Rhodococcus sp. T2V]